jgi:exopolyphosphatase/guanosine-5'-triphosphate,3'-diphosphate pyrophosphatase
MLNEVLSRSARPAEELVVWTDKLVRIAGLEESSEQRRLRHAACLLSDVGWRVHPDYRGEQTLNLITNGNFGAIDHAGRAFVALAVFYRYAGLNPENAPPIVVQTLIEPAMVERARMLGAAFRVAHLISAAQPGVLPATRLTTRGRKLILQIAPRMGDLVADRVGGRFKQLARLVGRSGSIVRM